MLDKLLGGIESAAGSIKGSAAYKCYDRINGIFKTPVKLIIGPVVILCAILFHIFSGFAYSNDAAVALLIVFGMYNLVNAMFSAIYKIQISYIPFMVFNAAGFLLYMLVISKYEVIGRLFMILFIALIFVAVWICDMYLLYGAGPKRRILGGLIVNVVMIVLTTVCVAAVSAISYIMQNAA